MTYLEFLGRWYNLPWLAALAVALVLWLDRRLRTPGAGTARRTALAAGLVATAVLGLTLNGAVHDLVAPRRVGRWFPLVAMLAALGGWLAARLVRRISERRLPPVNGVTWNRPDLEGREAVVLNARLEQGARGRARHRDGEGVSHIVRVHLAEEAAGEAARFGARIRLGAFDAERDSYPAHPEPAP